MVEDIDVVRRHNTQLAPYIQRLHECTKVEAELMVQIVFMAMTHKVIETGSVSTPMGKLVFSTAISKQNPLRVKLYMPLALSNFLNFGAVDRPTALKALLAPEHYELLSVYQSKAMELREEYLEKKGQLDGGV